MSEKVWVPSPRCGGHERIYHTSDECQFVGEGHAKKSPAVLHDDYRLCRGPHCGDAVETAGYTRPDTLKDLLSMDIIDPECDLEPQRNEQKVWIAPHRGKSRKYHTKDDCPELRDHHVKKPLRILHNDMEECKRCDDDYTPPQTEARPSLRDLIKEGKVETADD